MKTILLKFAGPLQAWGTDSHFEIRHTDFHPSKSAVIGLIAASLGYRRDEDEKIRKLNEMDFAVRIDQKGRLLRDYHIVQKNKKTGSVNRTYVTHRYYLEDAVFLVAVSHSEDEFIDVIEEGLRRPYFQQFMGRRSLPLPIDCLLEVENKSSIQCLQDRQWEAAPWYKVKYGEKITFLEIYADSHLVESHEESLRADWVISFSQKNRKFGVRYESRITVPLLPETTMESETSHDVFDRI